MNRSQATPSMETAMEDWVRACAASAPERTPEQFLQLQFHWGKPPPAADPRTRIFKPLYPRDADRGKVGYPGPGQPRHHQRTLKYMVTSKPTRRSTNSGLVHIPYLLDHNKLLLSRDYSAVCHCLPTCPSQTRGPPTPVLKCFDAEEFPAFDVGTGPIRAGAGQHPH